MKGLDSLDLSHDQRAALDEAKREITQRFAVRRLLLFGSVARGEADEESDVDVLVITAAPLPRSQRHQITDLVCDINLKHDANLSALVVDEASWERGLVSFLPIRQEVEREGVAI